MNEVFIIAEAGVNHNGEKEKAYALIDAAAEAGADAVKFQTFSADRLASQTAPKAKYQIETTSASESQYEMLKSLELPESWHSELMGRARDKGIQFISTAFDIASLRFLEGLDLPLYKIPSGEITNAFLLRAFARTGKPVILSTGMSTLGEVEAALAILAWSFSFADEPNSMSQVWEHWSTAKSGEILRDKVSLLHCTSQYPTPLSDVNLRAMDTLANAFGLPVGYSDHTEGVLVPVAAVSRGAKIIEKHFTLDRNLPGPDHTASLEPAELSEMVDLIRDVQRSLGDGRKKPQQSEWDTRAAVRQRIVAREIIAEGERFTHQNIGTSRAAEGATALRYWDILNTTAKQAFDKGDPIDCA